MQYSSAWTFKNEYEFKIVDDFKVFPSFQTLTDLLKLNAPTQIHLLYSEEELKKRETLKGYSQTLLKFKVGVFYKSEMVAFTYAMQTESDNLHMAISGVHPDHQRKGIYSELLRSVKEFSHLNGFQTIDSSHRMTNNPIIIAKLKANFVINGMIVSDTMGTLVRLTYFNNPERRKLIDARVGLTRPEGQMREWFF